MEVWLGSLGVVLVVYLVCRGARPPCNLRIVVRDSQVQVSGKALRGKHSLVSEFFRNDLPDVRRARVEGNWDGRRLQLWIRGPLSPGLQQRIRNFLNATL